MRREDSRQQNKRTEESKRKIYKKMRGMTGMRDKEKTRYEEAIETGEEMTETGEEEMSK